MVSATNTIDGGGGGAAMALPAMTGPLTATSAEAAAAAAAEAKKIRKPYTITKSRESWTDQEHDKFLEALQFFDRDWKKIEAFVGSKTVIQIRSHAQKYFLKVQKNGTSEHVPPPRPKRKAAHPYPQKASKNASLLSQPVTTYQASSCLLEPGYVPRTDSSSALRNSSTSGTMSSWAHSSIHPRSSHMTKEGADEFFYAENIGPAGTMVSNNCCSSTKSPLSTWLACETIYQVNHVPSLHGKGSLCNIMHVDVEEINAYAKFQRRCKFSEKQNICMRIRHLGYRLKRQNAYFKSLNRVLLTNLTFENPIRMHKFHCLHEL